MFKKSVSLILVCLLLLSALVPVLSACAEKDSEKADSADVKTALNAVLIGATPDLVKNSKKVSGWNPTMICEYIETKLFFDQTPYIEKISLDRKSVNYMGITDGGVSYDLDAVQDLTKDVLGVDFPQEPSDTNVAFAGDRVIFPLAEIDFSEFSVQDYTETEDKIIAVGTIAFDTGGNIWEFGGYFHAEFQPDPSGAYGYTLSSIYKIEGNRDSEKLTASASSELSDVSGTHYARYLVDEMYDTVWTENASGVGIGEWVEIRTKDGSKLDVSVIQLAIGHQKSKELKELNGYPTHVRIECDNGYKQEEGFYSSDYDGIIRLGGPQEISSVRITILDAEAGDMYEDTCISEIFLRGLDAEAYFEEFDDPAENPSHGESNVFLTIAVVALALAGIAIGAYGVVIFNKNNALYRKN